MQLFLDDDIIAKFTRAELYQIRATAKICCILSRAVPLKQITVVDRLEQMSSLLELLAEIIDGVADEDSRARQCLGTGDVVRLAEILGAKSSGGESDA